MTTRSDPYDSRLGTQLQAEVLERFLRYVRIDTQSDRDSDAQPSTAKQLDLCRLLADELRELGIADVELTAAGHVLATVDAVDANRAPSIGLLAHVDTSPSASGSSVRPKVWRDYDGGTLELGGRPSTALSPETSPLLADRRGHDIVTSDGTTLLGADDKAGVAEIMSAVAYLIGHPELPRPRVRIAFTVDEEIGRGTNGFDLERFGVDLAYTVDGSVVGHIENETFSAVELRVSFHGVGTHAGSAKGKLVSALKLAAAFVTSLPRDRLSPETTDGRDGFVHPFTISGNVSSTTVAIIIRDFDADLLEQHVELIRQTAAAAVAGVSHAEVSIERHDQYRNMRETLERHPRVADAAMEAARRVGLAPHLTPVRGGTDGAQLSAQGLPTPNLFTGGNHFHSTTEWISVQDMAVSTATIIELVRLWAEREWRS